MKAPQLTLLHDKGENPRLRYTATVVFHHILGLDIRFTDSPDFFSATGGWKLNYTSLSLDGGGLQLLPSGALQTGQMEMPKKYEKLHGTLPYWEWDAPESNTDPLPLIFFWLSRMEEYLSHERDEHGRFPSRASVGARRDCLHYPVVDAWADWLRRRLNITHPTLAPIPKPAYRFTPTYDIDHVRAYCWKGAKRSIGGALRDLSKGKTGLFTERIRTYLGKQKDPYDVFDHLSELHAFRKLKPLFFWLLGDYGPYDKNPNWQHPAFQKAIRSVDARQGRSGIHPSYPALEHPERISEERQRLGKILNHHIQRSRFHFLRFRLPESYRALIAAGITEDYSMGYPDRLGFRAGTAHPFPWYDLERETATALMLHPLPIMDVTLKDYLGLRPNAALEECRDIIDNLRQYGGHLYTLWHNSSFQEREWPGWAIMYERLMELAQAPNPDRA